MENSAKKITVYTAEVTKGDEYIETGYKTKITYWEYEHILKKGGVGILLHKENTDYTCDVRRLYPCKILKEEYELVNTEEVTETETFEPKTVEWYKEERDWKDHWC